jgi:hypothetical protein
MRGALTSFAIRAGMLVAVWLLTLALGLDHQAQATWFIIALVVIVGWWAVY